MTESREAALSRPVEAAIVVLTVFAVLLSVHQLFNLRLFGLVIIDPRYLYLLAGAFLGQAFLAHPLLKGPPRWHDMVLAGVAVGLCGYFALTAERSLLEGWEYGAPRHAFYAATGLWLLILEATRRAGGWVLFAIVTVFSVYPSFADQAPGPIAGFAQPLADVIVFHLISAESSFGIPMRAFGQLVIGFVLFGVALQHTGGGRFFNDLALAAVGRFRGGAAKVAIFASGFMGSMSGSVISNVMTTGSVSIPAMRRSGFSPRYAAGTEACASTGGVLMPPVMGTTAFVMASFLGRPYVEIALAAAIPSVLYYFGLFVQIDAYAARKGLKGLARSEVPSLRATMRRGWQYLFVFGVLLVFMVGLRQGTLAPFYATALLLVMTQLFPATRLSAGDVWRLTVAVGRSLAQLVAVLLGIGLVVGAFSATGLAGTLVNDLVFLAGKATTPLLLMGALTAFVFGIGMTVTACYIFLAVVLAPALTQGGLDATAVHLFILYWGMVSFITPPVALGAYAAASLAGSSPLAAGLEAMRLGSVIYVIPFLFVLNPALIGNGGSFEVAAVVAGALIGVWLVGSSLQGHAAGFGDLGLAARGALGAAGLALLAPGDFGLGPVAMPLAALLLAAPPLVWHWRRRQ